jgi:hypothetical protein
MRKVPTPSRRFPFQLYFEDLGEIDEICLEALKRQSLLLSKPAPIRIERFVEKEFKTALRYQDLGPDNLGCTIFNSQSADPGECVRQHPMLTQSFYALSIAMKAVATHDAQEFNHRAVCQWGLGHPLGLLAPSPEELFVLYFSRRREIRSSFGSDKRTSARRKERLSWPLAFRQ